MDGELVFELKRPLKIVVKNEPEAIEVLEIVIREPNHYNMEAFLNFKSMGLELFRKELTSQQKSGEVPEKPEPAEEGKDESGYKEMGDMMRALVMSSYHTLKPSDFIDGFRKVIFCKGNSYVKALDTTISEPLFKNVHPDDWVRLACEYFAFFAMSDFLT